MKPPVRPPIDPGLLDRFRRGGGSFGGRDAAPPRPTYGGSRAKPGTAPPTRIAHLHDEEARVEETNHGKDRVLVAESGPVGALVLLLEIDRRGVPSVLEAVEAEELPRFAAGALRCRWSTAPQPAPKRPVPVSDLVGLARYALR